MSQPLVRERISARVDRDDWEVFRDIAAERGVTTSALGAAAYGQLARSPAAAPHPVALRHTSREKKVTSAAGG